MVDRVDKSKVSEGEVEKILNWNRNSGRTARIAYILHIFNSGPSADDNWEKAEDLQRERIVRNLQQR